MIPVSNQETKPAPSFTLLKDIQPAQTGNDESDRFNSKFSSVQPLSSNPDYDTYHCPHCSGVLFQGHVQNLKMVCFHCFQYIDSQAMGLVEEKS